MGWLRTEPRGTGMGSPNWENRTLFHGANLLFLHGVVGA